MRQCGKTPLFVWWKTTQTLLMFDQKTGHKAPLGQTDVKPWAHVFSAFLHLKLQFDTTFRTHSCPTAGATYPNNVSCNKLSMIGPKVGLWGVEPNRPQLCTVVPRLLNRVTHLQGESVEHTHLLHLLSNVTHQSNSSKPEQGSYQARLEGYQNPSVDFFLLTRSSKPPKD